MSSQVVSTDNATVVIQINPQVVQDSAGGEDKRGPYHSAILKGFLKVQPKSLGTVQIMTGVIMFVFGILLSATVYGPGDFIVFSGITYWGSVIYIISGSLSVAAENKLCPCVVKASLGMNVFSAITAGIAIFLMSVQLVPAPWRSASKRGTVGILLVFCILQFIISICISAFACKATCDTDTSVISVSLNQVNNVANVMATV